MADLVGLAGMAELHAALTDVRHDISDAIDDAVGRVADEVAQTARDLVPKDSGDLADSIEVDNRGHFADVTAGDEDTVDYAGYVEFGAGGHQPPGGQPYMRPAADVGQQRLPAEVTTEIQSKFA